MIQTSLLEPPHTALDNQSATTLLDPWCIGTQGIVHRRHRKCISDSVSVHVQIPVVACDAYTTILLGDADDWTRHVRATDQTHRQQISDLSINLVLEHSRHAIRTDLTRHELRRSLDLMRDHVT